MSVLEKSENPKTTLMMNKNPWQKPVVISLSKNELSRHIQAMARSMPCMKILR